MSIVLLISETTLKKYTVVNDNVDAAYITPSIVKAQEIGLQPLIGSVLYRKLCEVADTPPDERTEADQPYVDLINEYVTPYLCNKTTAEVQWAVFAKIKNNGIVTSQDQQTQQMSIGDCEYLRKKYDYDADFYGGRLTDYLKANTNTYPEYMKRESCADIKADADAYKTNIVL